MEKNNLLLITKFCCVAAMLLGSFAASASNLKNAISVGKVEVSRNNRLAGFNNSSYSCSNFSGTHAGNTIVFDAYAEGGAGRYVHTLTYQLPSDFAFKEESVEPVQFEARRRGNGKIEVELPSLNPQVPFVDVTFFLISTDRKNNSVTKSIRARISRTVILHRSSHTTQQEKSCFQRYESYLAAPTLVSNGSSNTSRLEIRQGVDQIWASTRGWQFGVYVSPLSWLGLGNLVSLNWSYFQNRSKQVTESTYISSTYDLDPGDYLQVYIQPTRHVTAYDAYVVNPCGETRKLEGAYLFQWWSFAYHVYPVDPFAGDVGSEAALVGAPAQDTCKDGLDRASFTRTN